jgi:hypothetical protein
MLTSFYRNIIQAQGLGVTGFRMPASAVQTVNQQASNKRFSIMPKILVMIEAARVADEKKRAEDMANKAVNAPVYKPPKRFAVDEHVRISDPWINSIRLRCRSGSSSSRKRSFAVSRERQDTSVPRMVSNCFSDRSILSSLPSPHPRSTTRFAPVSRMTDKTVCNRWSCREGARSDAGDSSEGNSSVSSLGVSSANNRLNASRVRLRWRFR